MQVQEFQILLGSEWRIFTQTNHLTSETPAGKACERLICVKGEFLNNYIIPQKATNVHPYFMFSKFYCISCVTARLLFSAK